MNIVVVGCGKIGKEIISSLMEEKHNVTAVDLNPRVIDNVTATYDVIGICGSGTEFVKLRDAGVKNADLFIAATNSDEINMLSCFVAGRMGAKHTVARIRNTENNDAESLEFMKNQLGLSMSINPEMLTAKAIFNILKMPSATKVETFSSHSFDMVELVLRDNSPIDGISLIELRKKIKEKFLVCTVSRDGKVYIPQGNFILKKGDKIGIILSPKDSNKIFKAFDVAQKQARDVIIMGGGKTSAYLAKMLIENHIVAKVIEVDKKRSEDFCELVPGSLVINGNGMNQDLLREEGITTTDAFVSLTGHDEENILISFYAISQKVPKVISKVNREELSVLSEKLGLDSILSPKKLIADTLVQYARALSNTEGSKVETLYRIMNGGAEALEFNVLPEFEYLNVALKNIKFKDGILLAGIVRGRENIIPSGDDVIKAGDKVIVIVAGQRISDLESIVRGV
ncbi:MAG: Trk system potassium transporter TrkA [Clostridia bacterium]|nr:Trk system potassium transporter TrkA [Clostridia bacterium]